MGKDYSGLQVNGLTVLRRAPDRGYKMWWVRCYCGKEFTCRIHTVLSGERKSCGCYKSQRAKEFCKTVKRTMTSLEVVHPDGHVERYESEAAAARATGIPLSTLHVHTNETYKGYTIKKI